MATITFLLADIKQLSKMWKVRRITAVSRTHLKMKIFACLLMTIAYLILNYYISMLIVGTQLALNIFMLYLAIKYHVGEEQ
ncbi:MAG: hypothetical protein ACLFUH_01025 [Bacteroidales bacterium]